MEDCIRCREAPACGLEGFCGHCHWAVRTEIEVGLRKLEMYLRPWAEFAAWLEARDAAATNTLGAC